MLAFKEHSRRTEREKEGDEDQKKKGISKALSRLEVRVQWNSWKPGISCDHWHKQYLKTALSPVGFKANWNSWELRVVGKGCVFCSVSWTTF